MTNDSKYQAIVRLGGGMSSNDGLPV